MLMGNTSNPMQVFDTLLVVCYACRLRRVIARSRYLRDQEHKCSDRVLAAPIACKSAHPFRPSTLSRPCVPFFGSAASLALGDFFR